MTSLSPDPTRSSASDSPQSPWTRRWFILSLALLLALLASTVFLFVRGPQESVPTEATPPVPSSAPASTGPSAAPLDQTVPTEAPADVTWDIWETVALPYSASAGPRRVEGDVASGYAHTPTGALIAGAQTAVRVRVAQDWEGVVNASVAPGPGRDAWAATRGPLTLSRPKAGDLGQIAGFQFVSYTEEQAVIQLVSKFGNGQLLVVTTTLAWDGSDWRLVLTPEGAQASNAQTIPSLVGFIPWGGI
ncbi:hypothetical protein [Kineococcus sp. NUM-3379]